MSIVARPTRSVRWLPAFVALSAIWGSSFGLIKIAVDDGVPPLWISFIRCGIGAATLWALVVTRGHTVTYDRHLWLHTAVAAVLLNSVPFTLIAYAEGRITSVLAGVLTATTPLFTLGLVLLGTLDERPNRWRLAGLGLGLIGVVIVVDTSGGSGAGHLLGAAAVLAAAACYGAGYAYTRRFLSVRPESGTTLAAIQITFATVQLGLVAPLVTASPGRPTPQAVAALLVLGILGTGFAYVLNFVVIRSTGPTVASTVTYAVPVWSTGLGALLLAEHVGWNVIAGGVLVIGGIAISRRSGSAPRSRSPPS